ncbi:soma ferritin-like [Sycon ciliatum]|uniref:soma ferritin-like n=1 Tax=Sycon ciliatum TaxID=27933 RepID=UPI0020AA3C5C|eukprot:scpid82944/ scgid25939/ Soma ferritin
MSLCRQNYAEASEAAVNKQINMEFEAMYAYTALAAFYARDDIALGKVSAYFQKSADEEKGHADKLISYQNLRGGRVCFTDIKTPQKTEFKSVEEAFQTALDLEKRVNQSLLDLHKVASDSNDAQMTDFIEGEFLGEQVDAIKELSDHVANLKRVGPGMGEWHFNQAL